MLLQVVVGVPGIGRFRLVGVGVAFPGIDGITGRRYPQRFHGLGESTVRDAGMGPEFDQDAGAEHVDRPHGEGRVLGPGRELGQPLGRLEGDRPMQMSGGERRAGHRAEPAGIGRFVHDDNGLRPSISIVQTLDVILADIGAGLDLDQMKWRVARVGEAMGGTEGNHHRL